MAKTAKTKRQHKLFARKYIEFNFSGAKAAVAAGYSENTARTIASKLLTESDVQGFVAEYSRRATENTVVNAQWVLDQTVKLHARCMGEEQQVDTEGELIFKEDGDAKMFPFNATGAAAALKIVGQHVKVQAFQENITIQTNDHERWQEALNAKQE